MKIAFASDNNIDVNQHFGWSEKFYIYDVMQESYIFVDEVNCPIKIEDEFDKLEYKISSIEGVDVVYVTQVGPKASNMLKMSNIYPIKSQKESEKIKDVIANIQNIMKNNPPLWLKRILLK